MKIVLDPTPAEFTILELAGKIWRFPHAKKDSGAAIIRQLAQLKIGKNDELTVVVGPGNFTALRTACLIGNAVKFLTNCQLSAKKVGELKFKKVGLLQPFYASEPKITLPRK
ncbi:MAG: hypothetical protein V2A63_01360 [Patescibacteria group bacterium]